MTMSNELLVDRYEIHTLVEEQFVRRAVVKDHKAFGKLRTILSLTDYGLTNPHVVTWFEKQSELFTGISSDHVVDFIDRYAAGEMLESPAIVIEEPGMTLAELMTRGAIHPTAAVNIVTKILHGVNELHERGFLHLDIRPEMIGVNESATEVKLLSLGNLMDVCSDCMSLAPNIKYGAPECHIPTLKMERGADIYSIGFLFYEMLCGSKVFSTQLEGINEIESGLDEDGNWTNWHVSDKALVSLEEVVPELDDRLVACVHKMIEKKQPERFSTVATVINELNLIAGNVATFGLTGSYATSEKRWQEHE